MGMKAENKGDDGVREAFRGLVVGLTMMVVVFLVLHFFFGIKILA